MQVPGEQGLLVGQAEVKSGDGGWGATHRSRGCRGESGRAMELYELVIRAVMVYKSHATE